MLLIRCPYCEDEPFGQEISFACEASCTMPRYWKLPHSFVILGRRPEDPESARKTHNFNILLKYLWILGTVAEDDDGKWLGFPPACANPATLEYQSCC